MATRKGRSWRAKETSVRYREQYAIAGSPHTTTFLTPASAKRSLEYGPLTPTIGSSAKTAAQSLRRSCQPGREVQNSGEATPVPKTGTRDRVRFLTAM